MDKKGEGSPLVRTKKAEFVRNGSDLKIIPLDNISDPIVLHRFFERPVAENIDKYLSSETKSSKSSKS